MKKPVLESTSLKLGVKGVKCKVLTVFDCGRWRVNSRLDFFDNLMLPVGTTRKTTRDERTHPYMIQSSRKG